MVGRGVFGMHVCVLERLASVAKFHWLLCVLCSCSDQPTGRLALVFELLECNIYEMIKGRRQYLPENNVKSLMYQLMKSMDHMHK